MKKCTIAISSVNHALRSERLLNENNIYSKVKKLPPEATKKGCAYGIEVNCKDVSKATSLLDRSGISYSEILR